MSTPIEYLRLENRHYNALIKNGIDFVEKLAKFSLSQLDELQGIGKAGMDNIMVNMQRQGYEIKPKKNGWRLSKFVPKDEKNRASGVSSGVRDERSESGENRS